MDRPCQFSVGMRLDGIFPVLKVSYRTLGNTGLASEELSGKLPGSRPDFFQIFRINYSFVFPKRLIRRVQQGKGACSEVTKIEIVHDWNLNQVSNRILPFSCQLLLSLSELLPVRCSLALGPHRPEASCPEPPLEM
jgi:hypothetical protein